MKVYDFFYTMKYDTDAKKIIYDTQYSESIKCNIKNAKLQIGIVAQIRDLVTQICE